MKSLLRALAVVGVLLLGLAAPTSASADRAVVASAVNLRAGAGAGFARLATIPPGESVWVQFCRPKWCNVIWRNLRGWVWAAYLDMGYVQPAPSYDYFHYDYDFGYPYPHPWPRPPHKPPHCKPGKDCHPPPHCKAGDDCEPPHCKHGHCKPWSKPGDGPPHWHDKPQKIEPPKGGFDGEPKKWKKELDDEGPTLGGQTFHKSHDDRFDDDRGPRDRRKWED